MKYYLAVPFIEKDEAKNLGAKWDGIEKKWYILDNTKNKELIMEKWNINSEVVNLVGEDRTFGGNELFIDMIPSSSWFNNVRSCIHPTDWDRVRNHIYERVNFTCECCNNNTRKTNTRLDAHERWSYDTNTGIQKLERLIALCEHCHQSTHMGLAGLMGKEDEAIKHLRKVRIFTDLEFEKHKKESSLLFKERSKLKWVLDISIIVMNGIKIMKNK